jgi:hypothetical protein
LSVTSARLCRLFLNGVWFREAATDSERVIFVRESMDWKVIDSEGLDDHFFVALTKHVFVDRPGRCTPANRALDEVHGSPQNKKKGCDVSHPFNPVWHY